MSAAGMSSEDSYAIGVVMEVALLGLAAPPQLPRSISGRKEFFADNK